nr:ALPV-177 [Albatrosspox virus]
MVYYFTYLINLHKLSIRLLSLSTTLHLSSLR